MVPNRNNQRAQQVKYSHRGVFLDLVREKMGECTALFIKKDTVRICILKRLTDHSVCALFIGMIESSEL